MLNYSTKETLVVDAYLRGLGVLAFTGKAAVVVIAVLAVMKFG